MSAPAAASIRAEDILLRARQAIERGGIRFRPQVHEAYIARQLAIAEPLAVEIVRRLENVELPDDQSRALLDAVPMMTAFAGTATDCLYRMMADTATYREDVTRAFALFVVGSAAVDHICDHQPLSLGLLVRRISASKLRAAISGHYGEPFNLERGTGLLAYATSLIDDLVCQWRRLLYMRSGARADRLRQHFFDTVLEMCAGEFGTATSRKDNRSRPVGRDPVWQGPLWSACLLVALTPDAREDLDVDALRPRIEDLGLLFAIVDDAADLEDDRLSGSPNRFLASTDGGTFDDLTALVQRAIDPLYYEDVTAWLYAWIGP